MATIKKIEQNRKKQTSIDEEGCRKIGTLGTHGGNVKWWDWYGKIDMVVPQKVKHWITIWSRNSAAKCIYSKKLEAKT